jgi:hypothetical protein
MEEQNQTGAIGPLELLSARLNIEAARRAGMGLKALANEHSTWHDRWEYAAVDKTEQTVPNAGRRGNRILSTTNRRPRSVEDGAGRS